MNFVLCYINLWMTFSELPELGNIVNIDINDDVEFLKESFHSVLKCDKKKLENVLDSLLRKFKHMGRYVFH